MPERSTFLGRDNGKNFRVKVPDFSTASAGEVTGSGAADRFVMPNAPDFSREPASAAAETPAVTFNFGPIIEEGKK